jgi:demethylmenaquinone methyltransferase/2-methoxy-6-polyprenyl-1,4-benzoquinol methylase
MLRECSGVEEAVGLDVSEAMLKIGREKMAPYDFGECVRFVQDDAVRSALPGGRFDAVTMGFGIRNTPDARTTLGEIHRLLKPGGLAAILEFSLPACPVMRGCYLTYLRWVVPVIGAVVSGDKSAYRYLNTSIEAFHRPGDFCLLMEEAGFCEVSVSPLTWGVASIYTGTKA